jgi:hypothetical protein
MIVRIMGEGQYTVPDALRHQLNLHDDAIGAAVAAGDQAAFASALAALLSQVRAAGTRLPDEELVASDVVLPSPSATIEEVGELSGDDGLISG